MVERNRVKIQSAGLGGQLGPRQCAGQLRTVVEVREQHGSSECGHLLLERLYSVPDVEHLAAVLITVYREEHQWLEPREPVTHRPGSEVWRARRPDRAVTRDCEECG